MQNIVSTTPNYTKLYIQYIRFQMTYYFIWINYLIQMEKLFEEYLSYLTQNKVTFPTLFLNKK